MHPLLAYGLGWKSMSETIQGADKVLGQLKIYIIHLIVNKNR